MLHDEAKNQLPPTPPEPGSDNVDLSEPREIKVKLPIEIHVKLQSLKITRGQPISKVVLEALEAYFRRLEDEKDVKPRP